MLQGSQASSSRFIRMDADLEADNSKFIEDEHSKHELIMREQDEGVDELGRHITRLGEMSVSIGDEMGAQNMYVIVFLYS